MADTTRPTDCDVEAVLAQVPHQRRREDGRAVVDLMAEVRGERATMWGATMVGFGSCHYRYASGREGDHFLVGLSPRRAALTGHLMDAFEGREDLLERLGPHTTGKACLYVKRLDDVDSAVLRELVRLSVGRTAEAYR